MVGGAVAALYVTLRFLLDVRVKDEEDLLSMFDLPVLAQIPVFTANNKNRSRYDDDLADSQR